MNWSNIIILHLLLFSPVTISVGFFDLVTSLDQVKCTPRQYGVLMLGGFNYQNVDCGTNIGHPTITMNVHGKTFDPGLAVKTEKCLAVCVDQQYRGHHAESILILNHGIINGIRNSHKPIWLLTYLEPCDINYPKSVSCTDKLKNFCDLYPKRVHVMYHKPYNTDVRKYNQQQMTQVLSNCAEYSQVALPARSATGSRSVIPVSKAPPTGKLPPHQQIPGNVKQSPQRSPANTGTRHTGGFGKPSSPQRNRGDASKAHSTGGLGKPLSPQQVKSPESPHNTGNAPRLNLSPNRRQRRINFGRGRGTSPSCTVRTLKRSKRSASIEMCELPTPSRNSTRNQKNGTTDVRSRAQNGTLTKVGKASTSRHVFPMQEPQQTMINSKGVSSVHLFDTSRHNRQFTKRSRTLKFWNPHDRDYGHQSYSGNDRLYSYEEEPIQTFLPDQFTNTNTFTNIGYLFLGYHLLNGNPYPVTGVDPGFRISKIFQVTYKTGKTGDNRFRLPEGVSGYRGQSCNEHMVSKVFRTASQYQKFFSSSMGVHASYKGFGGNVNSEYSEKMSMLQTNDYMLVQVGKTCIQYTAELDQYNLPAFHHSFLEGIYRTNTSSKNEIKEFLAQYGTHFVRRIAMGWRKGVDVIVKKTEFDKSKMSASSFSMGIQISIFGGFSYSNEKGESSNSAISDLIHRKYEFSIGIDQASNINPVPIRYQLSPLAELPSLGSDDKEKLKQIYIRYFINIAEAIPDQ